MSTTPPVRHDTPPATPTVAARAAAHSPVHTPRHALKATQPRADELERPAAAVAASAPSSPAGKRAAAASSGIPSTAPTSPSFVRTVSLTRHQLDAEEARALEGEPSTAAADSDQSAAAAASDNDARPCEEITIAGKRMSAITTDEIDTMLFDETGSGNGDGTPNLPSRIASLRVEHNAVSILPSSVYRLHDLNTLKIRSNQFQLMDDDEGPAEEHKEGAPPQLQLARNGSGLRALKQLHSLELVHESSSPLSSSQLPSSLTSLLVRNYDISDSSFFNVQLSNLQSLSLSHIRSLKHLPDSVNVLGKLQQLSITHNPYLTSLPESLFRLPSLTSLDASHNSLLSLPESLDTLTSLRHLDVSMNRLIILPRVFRRLRQRGCEVHHDHMSSSSEDEASAAPAVHIEEIRDMDLSTPAPVASSAAHPTKRKKQDDDADSEHEARSKYPRSSAEQSASTRNTDEPLSEEDDVDVEDERPTEPAPTELSLAASAIASAASRRAPMPKRKLLPEEAVAIRDPRSSQLKKARMDAAVVASLRYFHGELDYADRVTSGFIDAGRRSKLFSSIDDLAALTIDAVYKLPPNHGEREIILVDTQRDVRLKQICKQARLMMGQLVSPTSATSGPRPLEELHLQARLLACLVSDSFGGRVVVFSPHQTPFDSHVANDMEMAAPAAAAQSSPASSHPSAAGPAAAPRPAFPSPLASLYSLCHQEVNWWRQTSQSNVVLLCAIQHGLCRHRAILFKYLIDTLFSPSDVACKLVRGYREGGIGHAWNQIRFRDGQEYIVDTLDSPHLFRPISSMADPAFCYYPQWSTGESHGQFASLRDLHLARRGRLIGEGSYSQVFECTLPDSHLCAMKLTPISHLTTQQFASLLKEVRLLPHLSHPNIIGFLGYIVTTTELKLMLELVRGANLDTVIQAVRQQGKRFSVDDLLIILTEIARGMQYLHQSSTLHRDLKSAQVLVGHPALHDGVSSATFTMPIAHHPAPQAHSDRVIVKAKRKVGKPEEAVAAAASSTADTASHPLSLPAPSSSLSFFSDALVKLCDFNIAVPVLESKEEDAEEAARHLPKLEYCGTLRWAAPEVFRAGLPGRHELDASVGSAASTDADGSAVTAATLRLRAGKASDVWSYCCVVFELLTLHLPYEDVPTEPELNAKLTRGERTTFLPWLDPHYFDSTSRSEAELEEQAKHSWQAAVAAASEDTVTDDTVSSTAATALFSSDASVYDAIVGLALQGTAPTPTDRPDIEVVCRTLTWLTQQRSQHAQRSQPQQAAASTTTKQRAACDTDPDTATATEPAAAAAATRAPVPLAVS